MCSEEGSDSMTDICYGLMHHMNTNDNDVEDDIILQSKLNPSGKGGFNSFSNPFLLSISSIAMAVSANLLNYCS
ncbi:hypothetical protein HNY73_002914 [Argiope bruennichi]|uniref:Uncharacterized protein n=1 Tax=Argiope bruennichi TaxID=94029 RepID=A0A8T0FWC6_ARGBR|nr:hypothetical protein HNY73_002914 [Argiope bruennichi]